ncbi:MAG: hypothetical protein ACREJN_16145, partial [Nitrospiraceae bacterium]
IQPSKEAPAGTSQQASPGNDRILGSKFGWEGTLVRGGWEDGTQIFVFVPKYWEISKTADYAYDDDVIRIPKNGIAKKGG